MAAAVRRWLDKEADVSVALKMSVTAAHPRKRVVDSAQLACATLPSDHKKRQPAT
jgi:hypothetical protein